MIFANSDLVNYLVKRGILRTPALIDAFRRVDRADFVSAEQAGEAYGDYPLPIGLGQTISQPTTVAIMLELLQPRSGEVILDVGAGSGWTTVLLAAVVGERGSVWSVELEPELVALGRANLAKYSFINVRIEPAGKQLGRPEQGPFDRILVSAAADALPRPFLRQLKTGGRLILPIGESVWQIDKISEKKIIRKEFPGFRFVPLRR